MDEYTLLLWNRGKSAEISCINFEMAYVYTRHTSCPDWAIVRKSDNVRLVERFSKGHSGIELMKLAHQKKTKSTFCEE